MAVRSPNPQPWPGPCTEPFDFTGINTVTVTASANGTWYGTACIPGHLPANPEFHVNYDLGGTMVFNRIPLTQAFSTGNVYQFKVYREYPGCCNNEIGMILGGFTSYDFGTGTVSVTSSNYGSPSGCTDPSGQLHFGNFGIGGQSFPYLGFPIEGAHGTIQASLGIASPCLISGFNAFINPILGNHYTFSPPPAPNPAACFPFDQVGWFIPGTIINQTGLTIADLVGGTFMGTYSLPTSGCPFLMCPFSSGTIQLQGTANTTLSITFSP